MTMQRGVLRPLRKYKGVISEEIIVDVQYFACPEIGETLGNGRVVLKIKALKPVDEGKSIEDGEYDFVPVTAGFVSIGTALQLRKSGDNWDWRGK